jgi:hypothetical protein
VGYVVGQTPDGGTILIDPLTGLPPQQSAVGPGPVGLDISPFQSYLESAQLRSGLAGSLDENAPIVQLTQGFWNPGNLEALFNLEYSGHGGNYNPYGAPEGRDVLRSLAGSLGLSSNDSDRAALEFASAHFSGYGQPFSEASHPALIANEVAKRLYAQAGKEYKGLSDDQVAQYVEDARQYQQQVKEAYSDDWKRDPLGSHIAFESNNLGNILEEFKKNPERAFLGSADPLSTSFWNAILGTDHDSIINQYGGPTKDSYKDASKQNIEVSGAAFYHQIAQMIASYYGSQGLETGTQELQSLANVYGYGQYAQYAKQAKDWYGYYKTYQNFKNTGDVNPGALVGAAAGATKAIGDFDSSGFTGSDSPFTSNSIFTDSQFGNNSAGGNSMGDDWYYDDYSGQWIQGDQGYDPSNPYGGSTDWGDATSSDPYGAANGDGAPNGNDGNGFSLAGLGNLFSGLGSGVGGLFGGLGSSVGGSGNNALALAPILAAIQYARNQGPFDTSRLTGLFDSYNPGAMANTYDRNTEEQRRSLTSSLADRGVMGSSFGNMDITNFNTNRELGRGALISQASLGGADIAQKILQAQIQERQLRNQMYGSALYSLGNVFGGKR